MGKIICRSCGYQFKFSQKGRIRFVNNCNRCLKEFPDRDIDKFVNYCKKLKINNIEKK